jgi:hypothetical protein
MSRPVAVVLGVLSALPLVYTVYFIWHIASLEPAVNPDPTPFERMFSLHLVAMGLILVLTAYYLVAAYRSPNVPNHKRTFWAIVLLIGNMFAFPVFWYFIIWRGRPADEKAL